MLIRILAGGLRTDGLEVKKIVIFFPVTTSHRIEVIKNKSEVSCLHTN